MFFTGLHVEIFTIDDETEYLEELRVDVPLKDYPRRVVVLYEVSAILPYLDELDNDREYTTIFSGSTRFIANIRTKDLELILNKHINVGSNLYTKT